MWRHLVADVGILCSTNRGTHVNTNCSTNCVAHLSTHVGTHFCTHRADTGKSTLLSVVAQCRGQVWHMWVGVMGEADGLVRLVRRELRELW